MTQGLAQCSLTITTKECLNNTTGDAGAGGLSVSGNLLNIAVVDLGLLKNIDTPKALRVLAGVLVSVGGVEEDEAMTPEERKVNLKRCTRNQLVMFSFRNVYYSITDPSRGRFLRIVLISAILMKPLLWLFHYPRRQRTQQTTQAV